jgi:hypothetical protein
MCCARVVTQGQALLGELPKRSCSLPGRCDRGVLRQSDNASSAALASRQMRAFAVSDDSGLRLPGVDESGFIGEDDGFHPVTQTEFGGDSHGQPAVNAQPYASTAPAPSRAISTHM